MLRVEKLKKTFEVEKGKVQALQGVGFDISKGEFFTLLGPSGSGKSTALRCVAGLEQPEEGEIYIDEQCVYSRERHIFVPPEERSIGMVFQSYAIWPHMDVFHNVAFPLLYGKRERLPKGEVAKKVRAALEMVQLASLERRPATQLSGGQQQRVALARALVRTPKLLLLDEPLSNLDAKLREEMRLELKELTHSVGITTLFVTHDQLEALAMSDRIGVIMAGVLVETGSPYEMYARPKSKVVAEFLGTANTLEGRVVTGGGDGVVETKIGPLRLNVPDGLGSGDRVTVVVRPEDFVCSREGVPDSENLFEGMIKKAVFLGSFVDGEAEIKGMALRILLNSHNVFVPGERVYVRIPKEHCRVTA